MATHTGNGLISYARYGYRNHYLLGLAGSHPSMMTDGMANAGGLAMATHTGNGHISCARRGYCRRRRDSPKSALA